MLQGYTTRYEQARVKYDKEMERYLAQLSPDQIAAEKKEKAILVSELLPSSHGPGGMTSTYPPPPVPFPFHFTLVPCSLLTVNAWFPAQKKARKLKDADKPKRALSAYNFFMKDVRPHMDKSLSLAEQAKILGIRWKTMDDEREVPCGTCSFYVAYVQTAALTVACFACGAFGIECRVAM
jgi:hypothetical protein